MSEPDWQSEQDQFARWREVAAEAEQMAERAAADPTYRADLNLELEEGGPFTDYGRWLQACAKRVIPAGFKWDIVQAIGGRCFLTLRGIDFP